MKAIYIVRLDDAHPGQFQSRWDQIERILDEFSIQPIVSIIPKNKDRYNSYGEGSEADFWDRARKWQSKGWGIAVHGLHHLLRTGHRSILPISEYSEFSGKPYDMQLSMLAKSVEILRSNGCSANYFVAPAHGYDEQTLAALRRLNPPLIVSDGFGFRPYIQDGIKFLPQQLWRGRWLPFGVWTICLHPSNMTEADFVRFTHFVRRNSANFSTPLHALKFIDQTMLDKFFCLTHEAVFRMKERLTRRSVAAK